MSCADDDKGDVSLEDVKTAFRLEGDRYAFAEYAASAVVEGPRED